jgi:WD40 repeat protein
VRIWDVSHGREQATIDDRYGFGALAFSPDGKTLATGSRSLKLWDFPPEN